MKVVFHYDASPGLAADLSGLADSGLEVTVVPVADREGFARAMKHCAVLWHVLEPVKRAHIEAAPNLKLIQKIGVGVNTIDLQAAEEKGIAVCNMPGTNSQAVAEMTLMLMLSALRQASAFDRATRRGDGWNVPPAIQDKLGEISGKVVGLIGYGEIPRRLAPALTAMGATLLYTATKPQETKDAEWRTLDALLREADIVSLHIPLTDASANLIDADALAKMKPGAVLVNTARGGVVDQQALVDALTTGRLGAAGLDVFADEPVSPDDPLLRLENVTLAPHVSWLTRETLARSIAVATDNCHRLRDGGDLRHRVV